MKISGTENKSNADSSDQITQEELERLIASASTAIHRQALQQKLTAMKGNNTELETDQDAEVANQPETQNDEVTLSTIENSAAVDSKNTPIRQDEIITEKPDADEGYDEDHKVTIGQTDAVVENNDLFVNQDNTLVENEKVATEREDESVLQDDMENEKNQFSIEPADNIVENDNISTNQDEVTVEQDNFSIRTEDSINENTQTSAESSSIKTEHIELPTENNSFENNPIKNNHETINTIEKIAEPIEENAVLKQGKKPDNFYVSMQPKSRLSRAKMAFSVVVIAFVVASSMVLIQHHGFNLGFTSVAELNSPENMAPTSNDSEALNKGVSQDASPENTMADMYRAKSIALDSLLKLDELVASNPLLQTETKSQIKRQLESAKTQQANGQYDQAEKAYQQVSAQLEDIMSAAQQLSASKSAAELARLNWESYRWNLLRDTQNLPLNKQEIMLIDLETKTHQMAKNGAIQEALEGYQQIAREYTGLLSDIESAARLRASVASLQREWRQISDTKITEATEAYLSGIKFENTGSYSEAIDSYRIAENQYKEALEIAANK